ncbi:MAG: hypothetical protein HC918_03635 [Oscillatoriales cyanobacterium SM2_1_8]|nr:hypothetical protein [Oscillatoriales cyanobacterium SM2_1_8]
MEVPSDPIVLQNEVLPEPASGEGVASATAPESSESGAIDSGAIAPAGLRVTLPQESFPGLLGEELAETGVALPPLTNTAQLISLLAAPPDQPILPPPPPPIVRIMLAVQEGVLQVFLPKEEHFQRLPPESSENPEGLENPEVWDEVPGDEVTIWQEMLTQLAQMLAVAAYPQGMTVCVQGAIACWTGGSCRIWRKSSPPRT